MSHISTLEIEIRDLDDLESACRDLGLELRRDQKLFRTYSGRHSPCDAAIVAPDRPTAYEIGLVARGRSYELRYDDWSGGRGMMQVVGEKCGRLLQSYTKHRLLSEAKRKGWTVRERKLDNDRVALEIVSGGSAAGRRTRNWKAR